MKIFIVLKKSVVFLLTILRFYLRRIKINTIFFFPFYHTGGAERVHLDIVKSLPKKKSIVIFTSKSSNNHFLRDFQEHAYCFEIAPYLNNFYYKKILNLTFRLTSRFNKITIFGCNSRYFYDVITCFNKKVKKIDLLHAFTFPDHGGMEIYSLDKVKFLDYRIVINQKTKNDYKELYKENQITSYFNRIKVINNAVEVPNQLYKKQIKEKLNAIYCGRIAKEKRVDIVVDIGKHLQDKINLSIYGNIEEDVVDIDLFYKKNVNNYSEIKEIYCNADILLITSYREGFPMVIMEAMAYGVICISTNVGGISEHIKNGTNGYLIENDLDKLKVANDFIDIINKIKSDENKFNRMSENSYNYAKENFTFEKFKNNYRQLLLNNE